MLHTLVLAQAFGGGATGNILLIGGLLAIMYFVMIRPQQKQQKEQQNMLGALKKGDEVITSGGLLGKVFAVAEKVITLEVSSGVKLRVLKSSIQGKVTVTEEPAKVVEVAKLPADEKKEDK